jgi:phage gp46-like protein
MADIRIVWSPEMMTGDWALAGDGLDGTQALVTAVVAALFTWRTADVDDALPGGPEDTDRKGWWGDHEAAQIHDGWPIGSRLWLLVREKQTDETRNRAEAYLREALDPFVTLGAVDRYDCAVDWFAPGRLGAEITLHRGPDGSIAVRFESLWEGLT